MVKKITKYLKFVVCCALIMSLVAPSYAALSASDGSAFVTKAEFDSALADFNARLTTFEAGINSKIDSQVSSYLDRNGIWNGKDQTFLNSWNDWIENPGESIYDGINYPNSVNGKGGVGLQFYAKGWFDGRKQRLVQEFNKSGLVYLTMERSSSKEGWCWIIWTSSPDPSKRESYNNMTNAFGAAANTLKLSISFDVQIKLGSPAEYNTDSGRRCGVILDKANVSPITVGTSYPTLNNQQILKGPWYGTWAPSPFQGTFLGFVQKGETMWTSNKLNYSGSASYFAIVDQCDATSASYPAGKYWAYKILKCVVY